MANNLVPQGDLQSSLGTEVKRWKEVHGKIFYGDSFGGAIADEVNLKATQAELARVEGLIAFASAPNYFERDTAFQAIDRIQIASPGILWLNINNKGHKLTRQVLLNVNEPAAWDTKATPWQPGKNYELDNYVADSTPGYIYRCVTAGTSSTLTPAFPKVIGATYNDGSVVWECCIDYSAPTNRAGKDFYLYALYSAETLIPEIILSANATVPSGYTADTSRKVGGFHCLCADVGTIAGHKLTGYTAGDILPATVWDLKHRPKSAPEGMAYHEGLDMWFSIYLLSWSGTYADGNLKLVSRYGAVSADGTSAEKWHCLKFEQFLGQQKQRLLTWQEFQVASLGSNQGTNVAGSADVNTTGGFRDTAGRRMISHIGLEDCCGNLWQWGADVGSATTGSSSYGNYYDANDYEVKGQTYGAVYRPLFGGNAANGAVCGSRASYWNRGALSLGWDVGARAASEPLAE